MQKKDLDKTILVCNGVYIIAILMVVLIFPIQFFTLIKRVYQIGSYKGGIRKYNQEKAKIAALEVESKKLKEDIKIAEEKISYFKDMSDVISYISDKAKGHNITIVEIAPDKVKEYKTIGKDKKILYVPINIEGFGNYHDVGAFINSLEYGKIYMEMKQVLLNSFKPNNRVSLIVGVIFKE